MFLHYQKREFSNTSSRIRGNCNPKCEAACFTFFALAFFSYVSDRGFFFGCSVALEKRSSNSLVLTMFGSFKEPHSVLLLQNRKEEKKKKIHTF